MSCDETKTLTAKVLEGLESEHSAEFARHLARGCSSCTGEVVSQLKKLVPSPSSQPVGTSDTHLSDTGRRRVLKFHEQTVAANNPGSVSTGRPVPHDELVAVATAHIDAAYESRFHSLPRYESLLSEASTLVADFEPSDAIAVRQKNDVLARISLQQGNIFRLKCNRPRFMECLREGERLTSLGTGSPSVQLNLLSFQTDSLFEGGRPEQGLEALRDCQALATTLQNEPAAGAFGLDYLCQKYLGIASEGTKKSYQEGLTRIQELLDTESTLPSLNRAIGLANSALAMDMVGHPMESIEQTLQAAEELAGEAPVFRISTARIRAGALSSRGDDRRALSTARWAIDRSVELGHPRNFVISVGALAELLADRGAWEEAAQIAVQGAQLASSLSLPGTFAEFTEVFATAMATGIRDPGAEARFRTLISTKPFS